MSDIFISYHKKSGRDFARGLKRRVQDRSLTAWLDDDELVYGDDWKPVIDQAIKQCSVMVVVVTLDALTSQYVIYEWSFAMGIGKRVIPLFLEFPDPKKKNHPSVHPKLHPLQYGDFTKPNESLWEHLLNDLQDLVKQDHIPQELQRVEMDLYSPNPNVRSQAIEFLLRDYNTKAVSKMFKRGLQSSSPDVIIDCARALAKLSRYQDEDTIPGLIKATESALHEGEAFHALIQLNTKAAINALVNELKNPKPNTRINRVMWALSNFKNPAVVSALTDILLTIPFDKITPQVIETLEEFKDPQSLPGLIHMLQTAQFDNLKLKTIQAMGKIGHPDALIPLCAVFKEHAPGFKQPDDDICNSALGTMRDIGSEQALNLLQNLKMENNHHFRKYSIAIDNCIRQIQQRLNTR